MTILVIKFKERKQSSEKRDIDVVEMQKCEAYVAIKYSGQGCDAGMEENVYDEIGNASN